ncbi:MAG: hypothetical protein WEA80_00245 [Gemmatimonadaceae bacterium]
MPVTAKLSRKFYDRLGDDIANELVDWFNAVDDTYRTQLHELNELNWNRFQAAMDARFAVFELKMEQGFAALKEAFDAKIDQRFGAVDARFTAVDARFTAMDDRSAASDLKLEQRLASMQTQMAEFEVRVERRLGDQTKWLVGIWLGTVIPIAGMILGLFNSIR